MDNLTSRLIIRNIPKYYKEEKLKDHIQQKVGVSITDVRIPKNGDGISRGFAFIGVKDAKSAKIALAKLNNTFIDTCKLNVATAHAPGSASIPRAWSRHTAGSSAFDRRQRQKEKRLEKKKEIKIAQKKQQAGDNEERNDLEREDFMRLTAKRKGVSTWKDGQETTLHPTKKQKKTTKQIVSFQSVVPVKAGVKNQRQHIVFEDDDDATSTADDGPLASDDPGSDGEKKSQEVMEETSQKIDLLERQETVMEDDDLVEWIKKKKVEKIQPDGMKRADEVLETTKENEEDKIDLVGETGRLLLLNLPYDMEENELREILIKYGELEEIHICKDEDHLKSKGRAFVRFVFPEHAIKAMSELHRTIIQGRLIRVVAAQPPKEKLINIQKIEGKRKKGTSSYKRILEEKQKKEAENSKIWNLLYVSANAAVDAFTTETGEDKRTMLGVESLDVEKKDESAAARVALGETYIIQQTKQWLKKEGINVAAFDRQGTALLQRMTQQKTELSNDTIIAKHLPSQTKDQEIFDLFNKSGPLVRYCLAPSGTVAVVQFMESGDAKKAFKRLAFSRFRNVPLFLEWAPQDVYSTPKPSTAVSFSTTSVPLNNTLVTGTSQMTTPEDETERIKQLLDAEDAAADLNVSLFVKNLNFSTTDGQLTEIFEGVNGFVKATITKKKQPTITSDLNKDSKSDGAFLSMGYGFVEFNSMKAAKEALTRFQGVVIDSRSLDLKLSQKSSGVSAIESGTPNTTSQQIDLTKVTNKVTVRNLPFEASKRDLRKLFEAFGTVVAVRIPKKADGTSRGYGFVEFASRSEAITALESLQHTHLYGRKMILEPSEITNTSIEAVRQKQKVYLSNEKLSEKFDEKIIQKSNHSEDV